MKTTIECGIPSCNNPVTHAEHYYDRIRYWCETHVPMSGHYEYCGHDKSVCYRLMSIIDWRKRCSDKENVLKTAFEKAEKRTEALKAVALEGGEVVDNVNHPAHYNVGGFEVADIADAFELGRYEFNVLKYLLRAKFKRHELEDLKKAQWYLNRRIKKLEGT